MRTAVILFALACALAQGQAETRPGDAAKRRQPGTAQPSLPFSASGAIDRREDIARIREQVLFQNQAHQQRLQEANSIYAAMGHLPKITDIEEALLAGMEIQRDLAVAFEGIDEDRARCLQILELVNEASRDRKLPAEAVRYLKGMRDAATNMLRFQVVQKRRLATTAAALKTRLEQMPPPGTFEVAAGIKMVLVRSKKASFYISREPISPETLAQALPNTTTPPAAPNWHQACRFCQWLTETASAPYALPTLEQMQAFASVGGKVPGPVWTRDLHVPEDLAERRMRTRFGVELVMLFDPNRVLGSEIEHEEVPFASYPGMSFFVVAPVQTGWWFRWNTLKQTLDK